MSRLSERTGRVSFCHLCRAMVSPKPGHVRLHASKAYLRYSTIITEYNRRGPVVGDFPEPYSAHCANISFTAQASERPSRIGYSYRWIESNTCGSWRRYQYCQPGPHWLAFDSNFQIFKPFTPLMVASTRFQRLFTTGSITSTRPRNVKLSLSIPQMRTRKPLWRRCGVRTLN